MTRVNGPADVFQNLTLYCSTTNHWNRNTVKLIAYGKKKENTGKYKTYQAVQKVILTESLSFDLTYLTYLWD